MMASSKKRPKSKKEIYQSDHRLLHSDIEEKARQVKGKSLPVHKAFIAWFLEAYIQGDIHSDIATTLSHIVDGPNDKGIDAIYIDDRAKAVSFVQGKYRAPQTKQANERRQDVLDFARLAETVLDSNASTRFSKNMPAAQKELFSHAGRCVRNGYYMSMYYVTLGKVSESVREEATSQVESVEGCARLEILAQNDILQLHNEWVEGVAPPIPQLEIRIKGEGDVQKAHVDPRGFRSYALTVPGAQVARLYSQAGRRIFARNVRGFLGENKVNRDIQHTIVSDPENFFYFNNGVTIVCDELAVRADSRGTRVIFQKPQIINGQQTTRTLAENDIYAEKCHVLIRVYCIPAADARFHELVGSIVQASNWQSAIRFADLKANDALQVKIERQLRQRGIAYLRKRENVTEARARFGRRFKDYIKRIELAYSRAACIFDPFVLRAEKDAIWDGDEGYYSRVFPARYDIDELLASYYIMKSVQRRARGESDRTYMKWLVTHHVWKELSPSIEKERVMRNFTLAAQSDDSDTRDRLDKCVEQVFCAAVKYYKDSRLKDQDANNFMRAKGHHTQLEKVWRSARAKTNHAKFSSEAKRLVKHLANYQV